MTDTMGAGGPVTTGPITPPPTTTTTQPTLTPNTSGVAAATSTPIGGPVTTTPIGDKLAAAANAAPTLDPASVVGVASSATTANDAAIRAQVVTAQQTASKMAKMLQKQDVDWQSNYWKNLSDSTKSMLIQGGYIPPKEQDVAKQASSGGFWHSIVHAADDVRHAGSSVFDKVRHYAGDVGQGVNDVAIKGPGEVFGAAMKPINQAERDVALTAQRSLLGESPTAPTNSPNLIEESTQQSVGQRVSDWLHILDPSALLHNWGAVKNGASSFQPASIQYVQKFMGITGPTLALAKVVAANGGTSDPSGALKAGLASLPQSERAQAAALIQSNPKFMDAVKLLSDSHLSIGQMLFGGLSAQQMHDVDPFTKTGAIEGVRVATDTSAAAAAAAAIYSGGVGPALGDALGGAATEGGFDLAATEAPSALESAGTLRGAVALGTGGLLAGSSALATARGETPDQATQISPFGMKINPISGIMDGLNGWYLNPLFVGMQANSAFKAAKYSATALDSMGGGRDVLQYFKNIGGAKRFANSFAKAVTEDFGKGTLEGTKVASTPNFAALDKLGISTVGMEHDITEAYPRIVETLQAGTPEVGVGEMMAKDQALTNLFRGKAGGLYKNGVLLPHLTIPQAVLEDLRGVGNKVLQGRRFNPGAMSLNQLTTEAFGNAARDAIEAEKEDSADLGFVARMGRRLTNIEPKTWIDLTDSENATQIERLARSLSLPEDKVVQARNGWSMLTSTDMKDDFLKALINDGFAYAGIDKTPEGQQWIDEFWNREHYSYGENAKYANPKDPTAPVQDNAIAPTQLSNLRALPNFREVYQFGKKSMFMSAMQMGLNQDMFDRFMQTYWKRVVLLRPGFAVRFAGEEALSFILRHGPAAYLQGRVASSIENTANATKEARQAAVLAKAADLNIDASDVGAMNKLDAGKMYNALTSHIPEEAQRLIKTRGEILASIQGWHAVQWLRRAGTAFTPDVIMDGAKSLADRGVLDTPFAEHIDNISGHTPIYIGDIGRSDQEAPIQTLEGTPVSISRTGPYQSYGNESQDFIDPLHFQLSGIATDPWLRRIAAANASGGRDAQMQTALDIITGRRIAAKIEDRQAAFAADSNEGTRTLLQAARSEMERHNKLISDFRVGYKTKAGGTVADGTATQEEINNDWANALVNHVNHFTMTDHGQEFTLPDGTTSTNWKMHADNEDATREAVDGPQPIRLADSLTAKTPWKIGTRDVDRQIDPANDTNPYSGIAKGEVRLFKAENATTSQEGLPALRNPGRSWTPNFQSAMDRAGTDGEVYKIDVPIDVARRDYDYHPASGQAAYDARYPEAAHDGHVSMPGDAHRLSQRMIEDVASGSKRAAEIKDDGDPEDISYEDEARRAGLHVVSDGDWIYVARNHADAAKLHELSDQMNHGPSEAQRKEFYEMIGYNGGGNVNDYLTHIDEMQHIGAHPDTRGVFESGDVVHGKEGDGSRNLLIDRLGQGIVPDATELEKVERLHWPTEILAPKQIAKIESGGIINRIMEYGMKEAVGRPANWLSRQPIFTYNYAISLDQAKTMITARGLVKMTEGMTEEEHSALVDALAHDIAMDRAFHMTIPFIHDPQSRSQFSVITRNLWPFWFAQEQFYKRWFRLFATYPEAWYKLSQTMNGLKSVGFVTTDQYGKEAFVYPGSQTMLGFLANSIFHANVPVQASFTGEISALNPTLTTGGAPWPSFGPIATVPMSILAGFFPHLEPIAQSILGPQAPPEKNGDWATQVIDQMLPSIASRLSEWYNEPSGGTKQEPGNATTNIGSSLYMSAAVQALQYLTSSGHDLTAQQQTNATDLQQYIDKVANWTKNLILIRAWAGLLAPASPNIQINDNGAGAALSALMSEMPYDEAVAAFIKAYPNATADTIFESTTSQVGESGTYVPATVQAQKFISDNSNFFETYPALAPWAIPAKAAKGLFNSDSYDTEISEGLRSRRPLSTPGSTDGWYQDYKFSQAAATYYPLESLMEAAESPTSAISVEAQAATGLTYEQAQAQVGMTGATEKEVQDKWAEFKTNFDQANPIFAEQVVTEGSQAAARRGLIVQDLQHAILNDALPKTEWSKQIEVMMAAYDQVSAAYNGVDGQPGNKGTHAATVEKENFITWGNQYAAAYPAVAPFWNGVLMKQTPG
jgi:hypothetical protein